MKQASLPLQDLQTWCHFNDVQLLGASIETNIVSEDGTDKGGGLVAKAQYGSGEPLAAIPLDLVLSKERVEECAKADKDLRELIEAAASLFQVGHKRKVDQHDRLTIPEPPNGSALVSCLPDDDQQSELRHPRARIQKSICRLHSASPQGDFAAHVLHG